MKNKKFRKILSSHYVNLQNRKNIILPILVFFSLAMLFTLANISESFADSQSTPLNDQFSLEKTVVTMNVPRNNVFPWGSVMGTINDPAQGYPVIIQFFNQENGDGPIHVAQVEVGADNTYEYKFRVRDVNLDTGEVKNIFEGEYTVKIFKVVNSHQSGPDNL